MKNTNKLDSATHRDRALSVYGSCNKVSNLPNFETGMTVDEGRPVLNNAQQPLRMNVLERARKCTGISVCDVCRVEWRNASKCFSF